MEYIPKKFIVIDRDPDQITEDIEEEEDEEEQRECTIEGCWQCGIIMLANRKLSGVLDITPFDPLSDDAPPIPSSPS
jgi:hypothetical protein